MFTSTTALAKLSEESSIIQCVKRWGIEGEKIINIDFRSKFLFDLV